MLKKTILPALLLCLALLLSACGGAEPQETISVEKAIETVEENLGDKVCVSGYPVAFFYAYTYSGSRVYSIYFSDASEDFFGEIEATEDVGDGWLEVVVKEKSPLWQALRDVFEGEKALQPCTLLLKGVKSRLSGHYYDFVALR